MQRATLSVGPALRKVREERGVTLEEAARDTRVRREFLDAIEDEDFQLLLGDVHLRGCLRTYATYLRLSPDKVVAMYETTNDLDPAVVPSPPVRVEPVLGQRRRRDDHRLWILVAATVLVLAGAFGILSARRPAPAPADLTAVTGGPVSVADVARPPITVAVLARRPVEVTIAADGGEPETFALESDEGRSFDAADEIWIRLSEGATARLTVNGVSKGYPGTAGQPWQDTYSYGSTPEG